MLFYVIVIVWHSNNGVNLIKFLEGNMQFIKSIFIKLICVFVLVSSSFAYAEAGSHNITKSDVIEAQKAWGEGIVNIGLAYTKKQNYTNIANKLVDELYDYDEGEVLFKPTKASEKQFRRTKEEAVSYFVKGIEPEDHGFALQPWSSVRFDNSNIIIHGDTAIAMGNYFFTDLDGNEAKAAFRAD